MEHSIGNRNPLNIVTNQSIRKISNKPNLVQHLTRSNPIQISSGLPILNTLIQSDDTLSYQPLVTISDNDDSDEDDFVSPIYKLTKYELREEVKAFHQNDDSTGNASLDNDNDTDDIEFRTHQLIKRSVCCYSYPFPLTESFCTIS